MIVKLQEEPRQLDIWVREAISFKTMFINIMSRTKGANLDVFSRHCIQWLGFGLNTNVDMDGYKTIQIVALC